MLFLLRSPSLMVAQDTFIAARCSTLIVNEQTKELPSGLGWAPMAPNLSTVTSRIKAATWAKTISLGIGRLRLPPSACHSCGGKFAVMCSGERAVHHSDTGPERPEMNRDPLR